MRASCLAVCLLVLVLVVGDSFGEHKFRKHKKYRPRHHKVANPQPVVEYPDRPHPHPHLEEMVEPAPLNEWQEINHEAVYNPEPESDIKNNYVPIVDPCLHKHCGAGRVCVLNDDGEAECPCIPSCPLESDPRRKVCTNHNETWGSDCEVYQMQCYCDEENEKCTKEEYDHIQIDYYGQCRDMPVCQEEEMTDFPRRMRDWLFNIMRDLADRQELSPHYLKLEREAETNLTRRWSNAAVWKWCDLDGHPHDRSVSRHELFPIRAPLMSLEHCIAPFLDSCDVDDDHRITLTEWAKCLGLEEDDLEDRCEEVRGEEEEE
ncbi:SPARC-like [Homalodisca vitripennis]|uniref:SPARC-like n=1 Tax=Homalodisca vitripennis TaxID=197043 RepID=UPI001EECCA5C|nr:SPARC-like [Homalodisca vitripennis]KAG8249258.1 hypothetical protein J6590_022243 [Homalodisca vitripennis]